MLARSLVTIATSMLVLTGCHRPEGALMTYTGQTSTYWSTESKPVTVTIVDTRTGKPFFTMEVPVGKQLTLDFVNDEGDDPVLTPDLMRWEVFERGTQMGTLRNAMSVPDSYARRIDVDYRPAPEYAPRPADQALRVDHEKPDWWTPRGGPVIEANSAMTIYDD